MFVLNVFETFLFCAVCKRFAFSVAKTKVFELALCWGRARLWWGVGRLRHFERYPRRNRHSARRFWRYGVRYCNDVRRARRNA